MPRETVVLEWCDICFRMEDQRKESVYTHTENGYELLLCTQHSQLAISELPVLIKEYGLKLPKQTDKPRANRSEGVTPPSQPTRGRPKKKKSCPIDPNDQFKWNSPQALGVHLYHSHEGYTVERLRREGLIQ